MTRRPAGFLIAALVAPIAGIALATSAEGAARVTVTNGSSGAQISRTGATTLRLTGNGFQSVRGGFGGIYVLFGTVSGNWRPSAHGSGSMAYVPDSQSKDNAGHQRFVAFPGGSTDASANGGTISASGHWATTLRVPGSTFTAVGSDGRSHTVDCAAVTCGVITVGAHGVANRSNETFTPVSVADPGADTGDSDTTADVTTPTSADEASPTTDDRAAPRTRAGKPRLSVDQATARAGKVLGFTATGLTPGVQVSAVFDDGEAGVGPLTVGASGELAAVIRLPADVGPGTHELRLIGPAEAPTARFAVTGTTAGTTNHDAGESRPSAAAVGFVGVAGMLMLASVVYAIRAGRGRRRA